MLSHHEGFPVAVLALLREQLPQCGAGPVARADECALPHQCAGAAQAQVVFVVLVAHQRFVETTVALKGLPRPTTEVDGLSRAFVAEVARARPADHPARLEGRRDGALHGVCAAGSRRAFGTPGAADVGCTGARKRRQALRDVVAVVVAVQVHAHQHLATGARDAAVEPDRNDEARVVDAHEARVGRSARVEQLARTVVTAAFGHQDFEHGALGQALASDGVAEAEHMVALVAAGRDDAHQHGGRGGRGRGGRVGRGGCGGCGGCGRCGGCCSRCSRCGRGGRGGHGRFCGRGRMPCRPGGRHAAPAPAGCGAVSRRDS